MSNEGNIESALTVPQLLEYLRRMPHNASYLATISDIEEITPKALATRGVQPTAIDGVYGEVEAMRKLHDAGYVPAAQQPSAPTPEQQTETGGKWLHDDAYVYWADPARLGGLGENIGRAYDETDAKRFCAAYQLGVNAALAAKDEQLTHELKLKEQAERELHAQDVELNALREQLRVMQQRVSNLEFQDLALCELTRQLVIRFARALAEKLMASQAKYGWWDEWAAVNQTWPEPDAQRQLLDHVAKGDPRDVAAFCAFLWHHNKPTALASAPAASKQESDNGL